MPQADHGIPQEDIDAAFAAGRTFLEQGSEAKGQYPFNPDSYLGWRGPDELETVTGGRAGGRDRCRGVRCSNAANLYRLGRLAGQAGLPVG